MANSEGDSNSLKIILRRKSAVEASEGVEFVRVRSHRRGDALISSANFKEHI